MALEKTRWYEKSITIPAWLYYGLCGVAIAFGLTGIMLIR